MFVTGFTKKLNTKWLFEYSMLHIYSTDNIKYIHKWKQLKKKKLEKHRPFNVFFFFFETLITLVRLEKLKELF